MRLVTLWPSADLAPSSDAVAMLAHRCRSLSDVSHSNACCYVPRPQAKTFRPAARRRIRSHSLREPCNLMVPHDPLRTFASAPLPVHLDFHPHVTPSRHYRRLEILEHRLSGDPPAYTALCLSKLVNMPRLLRVAGSEGEPRRDGYPYAYQST
jgi:hypothetical protein